MKIIKCALQTLQKIQKEEPIYNHYGIKDENYTIYNWL